MDVQVLEETAALAHLKADKDELAAALPAFEQMLDFFAAMAGAGDNATDTAAGQAAGAQLVGADHFRSDGPNESAADADLEAVLNNAGERDGRFIVIPNVL
jgi:aspartyl-tRNA(Asn)/glutamyl-tRNA(Gln) amidotransferase subunit C